MNPIKEHVFGKSWGFKFTPRGKIYGRFVRHKRKRIVNSGYRFSRLIKTTK